MASSIIKKLLIYEPLTSGSNGMIKIPLIKVAVIWGAQRTDSFNYESARGAYTCTKDLSSYGLIDPVWATVSPQYGAGLPFVGVGPLSRSSIMLLCNVNLGDCYVHWLVIGRYS